MKNLLSITLLTIIVLCGCGITSNPAIQTQGNSHSISERIESGAKYEGKIVKVVDGDTCKVNINGKVYTIRELDIDTPEVKKPNTPIEPFGPEASALAHKVLDNQTVTIEVSKKKKPLDKYHRLLAYIWVNGQLWEDIVISQGLAKVSYVYKPDTKYVDQLYASQNKAKESKLNIWSFPGYADPKVGYNMEAANQ